MKKIAILIASYNRRILTRKCLESLRDTKVNCDIFFVDDNSSDGTVEMLHSEFSYVKVILGNGDLFWNRSMAMAWEHALMHDDYDYFIWLNNDVVLFHDAISEMLECSLKLENNAVISGIIQCELSGDIIYGGTDYNRNSLIIPDGNMKEIYQMNGNAVLIPQNVFKILGGLDKTFHHDLGDIDYGFRAINKNIKVVTTTKPIGFGPKNNICRVRKFGVGITERFGVLYSPLGSHPFINFYFRKKHFGLVNGTLYFVFLHILNSLPDVVVELIFKDKYK